MAKTSIQGILLDEVAKLRKDSEGTRELLIEVATTLKEVRDQTVKTNGRMNRAEERLNIHRGGIAVIYAGIMIALAILTLIK